MVAVAPSVGESAPGTAGLLLSEGHADPGVAAYRARVAGEIATRVSPLLDEAEATGRFPRAAVAALGESGLLRERWAGGPHGDAGRGVVLSEELGRAGLGGVGVGVSVHVEAVLSTLLRFGRSDHLRAVAEDALAGSLVGCLATSEDRVGSDLSGLRTSAVRDGDGWRVRGTKAFVSVGAAADFALVLCRVGTGGEMDAIDEEQAFDPTISPPLVLACVPREGLTVARRLAPLGARGLETVRLDVDAHIPDEAILGRPGLGLFVVSWGLTHERLASAAQVLGGAQLGIALAATHMHRRRQFGARLFDHQALRLRIADLASQVEVARLALYALAGSLTGLRPQWARQVAALKVTVARLGERVASECMHVLGGLGYLEDDAPMARMVRDVRLARLGGGSDEMMWELVAAGLPSDEPRYDELVRAPG